MSANRNLSADDYAKLLDKLGACEEAREASKGDSLRRVWQRCLRGDWLLWLAVKVGVDRKLIVMAACASARTALKYVAEGEARPLKAIETAEAWCRGDATLEEVRTAGGVGAAAHAYAAADYAAYAAYAAAHADDYAAAAADYAAAAADCAHAYAARDKALRRCATIVRRHITADDILDAIGVKSESEKKP